MGHLRARCAYPPAVRRVIASVLGRELCYKKLEMQTIAERQVSDLPELSDLRADLVPHRQWATRRWFYANPIWYYHRPSADHEIRLTGRFFQLVDPMLREVCQLFNESGIQTTPSCQGHSYPTERFERIWAELTKEETSIRGAGLVVKDCESDEPFQFRSVDYRTPWRSFEDFHREAAAHQNLGYLGILFPKPRYDVAERLRDHVQPLENVRIENDWNEKLQAFVVGVHVNADDPRIREATWREFTSRVAAALAGAMQ